MSYLRALCNHARELRATEDDEYPVLPHNPVTKMFRLRKPDPEKVRTTRIPLEKVGAVGLMLEQRRTEGRNVLEETAVDWVCTMLLTGMRRTESGSLKWRDVDLDARIITLRGGLESKTTTTSRCL
jgi:integrase